MFKWECQYSLFSGLRWKYPVFDDIVDAPYCIENTLHTQYNEYHVWKTADCHSISSH